MKKQYRNNDADKVEKLTEPVVTYQTKQTIKIFKTFEEAKQNEIDFIIQQSPIERVQQTVALILRAFSVTGENLRERKRNNTITIIRSK